MKRKALIAVLCMVMSVSIINTGCSSNTSKKEEQHTTETNNKGKTFRRHGSKRIFAFPYSIISHVRKEYSGTVQYEYRTVDKKL